MTNIKIGKNIKEQREKRNLTQKELADLSGISRTYLSDVENLRFNPSVNMIQKISEALKVPLNALIKD